ncbi:MAG: protoporphyrinogen oxidase [Bacteroidetes bacterium]|nr:protoporphyrinogen oxidase [Bacteroidota bacterium]MCW5897134.1 protoporphyrinogen oxidase [Bacteroidota bacterium]
MSYNVVVVGAGISGLTAAYWLHKAGIDVTVLEKNNAAGGTMRTLSEDGWLIETGPNSALETTPLFNEMFEGLGILNERLYADERSNNRYILRDGKLQALPMSPGAFLGTSLWSVGGKLRLLKEPFIGKAEKEETIAEFVERRLGREFLDYAINPFVAGVYAGNPEQLSVRAAFPKLYALEEKYGGLIRGMIKGAKERKQRAEKAKDRARMFSFLNGMETFPQAIGARLGDRLRLGREVLSVSRNDNFAIALVESGRERSISADAVIVATPASTASGVIKQLGGSLSSSLNQIYYPPVAEVFLGFRREQIKRSLDGFGFLVPAKEQRKILGTIWSSVLFPGRAPEGHLAMTTFVGGSRQPELCDRDDTELVKMVTTELKALMNVAGDPVFSRIVRWPKAIPQYNLGYDKIVQEMERCEYNNPGLYFCSNFKGGIAVGDCVMNGKKVAEKILSLRDGNPVAA